MRIDVVDVDGESRRIVLNRHTSQPGDHMPTCTTCHAATIAAVDSGSSVRGVGVAGALSITAASILAIGHRRAFSAIGTATEPGSKRVLGGDRCGRRAAR